MPAIIPMALYAVTTYFTASAFISSLVLIASSTIMGSIASRKAAKAQRDQYNASQVDRIANVSTTNGPRELVLGRVRKGGNVYFRGTAGQYNEIFLAHIAIAGHQIDGVEQYYLNDVPVVVDGSGYVLTTPYAQTTTSSHTTNITAGNTSASLDGVPIDGSVSVSVVDGQNQAAYFVPFTVSGATLTLSQAYTDVATVNYQVSVTTSYARLRWEGGSPTAAADQRTIDLFPGLCGTNFRAQGVAKIICEFTFNDTAFPSGIPNVTAVVRGAQVYDPRTSTTAWSDNPALLARHVYTHPYFGKAPSVSAAEDARFIAAANACDVNQGYFVNGVTDNERLFRAAIVAPYGTTAESLLNDISASMAGSWAIAGGEIYIKAGVYTSPVLSLSDADLAVVQRDAGQESQDQMSIAAHRERNQKFNVVNLTIWDAANDYKQSVLTPVKSSAYITRDGEELAQNLSLPAVFYAPQAQHVAGVVMRDARDPLTFQASFKLTAYPLEPFDTVALTIDRYGWSSKEFMVQERVWDREKGIVKLTLKETSAAIFAPDAAFLPQGYASNTSLPTPWDISPLGTLNIDSGTNQLLVQKDGTIITRVRVTWPTISDTRITADGKIEVQWCVATVGSWNSIVVDGSASELFITGVADGMVIMVRARTRSTLASSDWGLQQAHVVLGKSLPPGMPTGVSITQGLVFFKPPTDLDLAGVRIRSVSGIQTAPVFSRGADVIAGLVRVSPARIERTLYGVQTIMVVAEDTSGNQSAPAFASLDFGQPDVASALWRRAFEAEGFPGTYTTCALSGGSVVADTDPSSNVYSLDNLYGEPDVYATLYLAMQWVSPISVPPYAGTLALLDTLAGNAPTVEYRISGDTVADLYSITDVYASADLYGPPGEWALWPGALPVQRLTPIEFMVTIDTSSEQGSISVFDLSLVVNVQEQLFSGVTVSSAGTRLSPAAGSPARNWIGSLRAVYGWPAADGSGAIAGRTLDFSPLLGPLVQFVDNTGTPVTALGTVKVEGYSDD